MRKNREMLRLKHELGLSPRQIATGLNLSHSTVGDLLRHDQGAGLCWPLADEMGDAALVS